MGARRVVVMAERRAEEEMHVFSGTTLVRGGRGARIDLQRLGLEDYQLPDGRWLSEFGRGGDGGHSPQYVARLMVIEEILGHVVTVDASSCRELTDGSEALFLQRLNDQLMAKAHRWRVRIVAGCF